MADVQEAVVAVSAANVTLTTTSETLILSSGRTAVVRQSMTAFILAVAQLTTGTGTTTVTPRIRRGNVVGGALVSEANAVTIGAAAGSNEQFYGFALEVLTAQAEVEYSLTLEQAAATGNGTALAAAILVLLL